MKQKAERYKTASEFGKALGLTNVEMELIRQKKRIIENLRKAREEKGLSQAALAHMVSSKQPAIARMESGQLSEVSLDFLFKVAMVLEVTISLKPKAA